MARKLTKAGVKKRLREASKKLENIFFNGSNHLTKKQKLDVMSMGMKLEEMQDKVK